MKKILFALIVIIVLVAIYPPKKMSNGSGMIPAQFYYVCNGLYIPTYDQRVVDGGTGGLCFGLIKQKQNPHYTLDRS